MLDTRVRGVVVVDGSRGGVGHGDDAGVVVGLTAAVRDADIAVVGADGVFAGAVGVVVDQVRIDDAVDGRSRDLREAAGVGAVDVEHGVTGAFGELGRAGDVVLVEDDVGWLSDVDGGGEVEHFILFGRAGNGGNARDKRGHSQDSDDAFHGFFSIVFLFDFGEKHNPSSCTSGKVKDRVCRRIL